MKYAERGLKHMERHSREVRWGHLKEIDRRVHVGSKTWLGWPLRLKHLSAWRFAHHPIVTPGGNPHPSVKLYSRRYGIAPSSDLPLFGRRSYPITGHPSKVAYSLRRIGKMK